MAFLLRGAPRLAIAALRLRRGGHTSLALRARERAPLRFALLTRHLNERIAAATILLLIDIGLTLENCLVVVNAGVALAWRDILRLTRRAAGRSAQQRVPAMPTWCELDVVLQRCRLVRLARAWIAWPRLCPRNRRCRRYSPRSRGCRRRHPRRRHAQLEELWHFPLDGRHIVAGVAPSFYIDCCDRYL